MNRLKIMIASPLLRFGLTGVTVEPVDGGGPDLDKHLIIGRALYFLNPEHLRRGRTVAERVRRVRRFARGAMIPQSGKTNVVENGKGDAATIRDFKGDIGVAETPPTGVATDPFFGGKFWAADVRFMKGVFVGPDNARHRGTFAFI
jgi:hypothetical protein